MSIVHCDLCSARVDTDRDAEALGDESVVCLSCRQRATPPECAACEGTGDNPDGAGCDTCGGSGHAPLFFEPQEDDDARCQS